MAMRLAGSFISPAFPPSSGNPEAPDGGVVSNMEPIHVLTGGIEYADEFGRLRRDSRIISFDIHSFAKIRLDEKHDRIVFEFTWLTGHCRGRVEGAEQVVDLRWSAFREFLDACRLPDGPKEFKAVSLGVRRSRPRLVFADNRENLRTAVGDRRVRRKLGKILMTSFN